MSSVINTVKSGVGAVTGGLLGGKTSAVQGSTMTKMTDEERKRLEGIEGTLNSLYANENPDVSRGQSNEATDSFQKHLMDFLNTGHGPNPTPEQLKQSQEFVDQTFYNPAQAQLEQYQSQFDAGQQAKAVSLGRNPNLDQSTNQAIYNEGLRNQTNLGLERGARVAQTAQGLNEQSFNRDLSSLNTGMQGSSYLNNLANQALQNRVGLLNQSTGLASFYQKERGVQNVGTQTSPGLLGTLSGAANQVTGAIGSVGNAVGALGKIF